MNSHRFGILIMPAANRVYAESSAALMTAELEVFNRSVLGGSIEDVEVEPIGGVPYLTFRTAELSERAVRFLSNLSSIFALFRLAAVVQQRIHAAEELAGDRMHGVCGLPGLQQRAHGGEVPAQVEHAIGAQHHHGRAGRRAGAPDAADERAGEAVLRKCGVQAIGAR